MERKMIQIPYRAEQEAMAKSINAKIGSYKALHGKRTLLDALYEMLNITEKADINAENLEAK